jgi:glucose/arabinose dehydrogenase/plastocyanin
LRRNAVLLAAALTAACLTPPFAHAADQVVTAAENTFVPGSVSVAAGSRLTFANPDLAPHNVIADATTKAGPLFGSATVTTGQTADVKGVETLKPATYPFHCSVHPQMRGSLTVTAPGATTYVAVPVTSIASLTSLTFFNGALYATSYAGGVVGSVAVNADGTAGAMTTYATGFTSPLGIAFAPGGTLYVSDSHTDANGGTVGRVWAVAPGGATKTTVIDGLPNGRHNTNGMAVLKGRLYVANGNNTDDGTGKPAEQPLSGTVLSYALPVKLGAKPTVEARGLRNAYDLAFRPGTTEAWYPTNGPDALDPYGEDLLHKTDVAKATPDFGFPACVYKAPLVRGQNPVIAKPCRPTATPEIALGLHVSADGIAFGTGGAWGNDVFIAEYGSNAPSPAGHRVVRLPMVNGKAGLPQDVVVGVSPLDVTFGPAGLYYGDFDTGTIFLLKAVG